MTRSSRWILAFFAFVFAGMAVYMIISYRINPMGYFSMDKGEYYYFSDDSTRKLKIQYIMANRDKIDAITIGGSKSGTVSVDLMKELTGLNYYNFYMNMGNVADYVRYSEYLIDHAGLQEITLCLSSFETLYYDRSQMGVNTYMVPAQLSGNPLKMLIEKLRYLMTDFETLKKEYDSRKGVSYYFADCLLDGMRNRLVNFNRRVRDPEAYTEKYVVNDLAKNLRYLFRGYASRQGEVRTQNLEGFRELRDFCKDRGVVLRVVIGPSFMSERYMYECPEYYSYMEELVSIFGEVWDFSDYNDINMNPYNFIDGKHYSCEVADLMMNTVFGKESRDGFGILLTNENIGQYMLRRREDFEKYRQAWLETKTVPLPDMEDESYLPWREKYSSSQAAREMLQELDEKNKKEELQTS